jgi:hypothetical protein
MARNGESGGGVAKEALAFGGSEEIGVRRK